MTKLKYFCAILISFGVFTAATTQASWRDLLEKAQKTVSGDATQSSTESVVTALSNQDIVAGLKEALIQGAQSAINSLGREDGFLGNPAVKIPVPEKLKTVEKGLHAIGQGQLADDFVKSMNRAAEQAVPQATELFVDAITNMSLEDATAILNGPDNAATAYLQKSSGARLRELMTPIVTEATDKVGVTKAYKNMLANTGILGQAIDTSSLDLDNYVTEQATNGLFQLIAAEEKRIRENPIARTTDLLKRVFSSAIR